MDKNEILTFYYYYFFLIFPFSSFHGLNLWGRLGSRGHDLPLNGGQEPGCFVFLGCFILFIIS